MFSMSNAHPSYCRQPTLRMHDFCLEVPTLYGNELRQVWANAFPILELLMSLIWYSSREDKTLNVFRYEAISSEKRTHHLPSNE